MANLYTSDLETPVDGLVDILIPNQTLGPTVTLTVSKFSALDEYIEDIIPPKAYVENGGCPAENTRIRVYIESGQLEAGEQIQISLDE